MPNVRVDQGSKTEPRRFPRNAGGKDIAKALERIWRLPRFKAHCTTSSTDFVFHLPFSIAKKLKHRNRAEYWRLFPGGEEEWASVLEKAYQKTQHHGKPVKNQIRLLLLKVLVEASLILLDEHKDAFHQDQAKIAMEQESLRKRLIRTGPQRDERKRKRTAIRLAKRYKELLPQVKEIRTFIKEKESTLKDTELRAEIARTFQYTWIPFITDGCASKNLLPIPGHDSRIETLSSEGWTVRQLSVGIIRCEELGVNPKTALGSATIYDKYIPLGNRLIKNERK